MEVHKQIITDHCQICQINCVLYISRQISLLLLEAEDAADHGEVPRLPFFQGHNSSVEHSELESEQNDSE